MPTKRGIKIERVPGRGASRSASKSAARVATAKVDSIDRPPTKNARGQRRVDVILDAASALLIEGGVEGLTIESVAKRSGTSKSSMYHFFSDLDGIISALGDRHIAAMVEYEKARDLETINWGSLTVEEVVDRYLDPLQAYHAAHPDLILVMRLSGSRCQESSGGGLTACELARAERIIAARLPRMKAADRRARAGTMLALVCGVMESSGDPTMPQQTVMLRELRTVLRAYLRALDKGH